MNIYIYTCVCIGDLCTGDFHDLVFRCVLVPHEFIAWGYCSVHLVWRCCGPLEVDPPAALRAVSRTVNDSAANGMMKD